MFLENRIQRGGRIGVGRVGLARLCFVGAVAGAEFRDEVLDVCEFSRLERADGFFDFGERHAGN